MQSLIVAIARLFALELPKQAAVLDQMLVGKEQLRRKGLSADAVQEAIHQELPADEPVWDSALQKVLLLLR